MKKTVRLLAISLAFIMLFASLASCGWLFGGDETESTGESQSQESGSTSESESGSEEETGGDDDEILISGGDSELIDLSNKLANKVNSGYIDVDRYKYQISNNNMILSYSTTNSAPQQVTSITDKKGNAYVTDSLDVFVRLRNGNTYYSSASAISATTNIYRLGYYYYESRIENQVFLDPATVKTSDPLILKNPTLKGLEPHTNEDGSVYYEITNQNDPNIVFPNARYRASEYKFLQITMKASGIGANGQVYVKAGGAGSYSSAQSLDFTTSGDGQEHVYTIPISQVQNYSGIVQGIRLDINGNVGSTFEIIEIKAIAGESEVEPLSLARSFLTYSNKLHQVIQVAATEEVENIASVGMVTKISVDRVENFVIRDKGGLHYDTLSGIAWNAVTYVGFTIKDVGVYGYIIPYDKSGGNIKVTLEDGYYVIEQTKTPDDWKIKPSAQGSGNANDFYMGQRIYTDTEKNLDLFIAEAEKEINPLGEENFIINRVKSGGATFEGYDPLRGYYRFNVDAAAGFRGPYSEYPNRHFGVQFTVKGDDKDRQIYVMTYAPTGSLECAAILNEQSMMLPIPIEVSKNFKGDGENTIFMQDDAEYSETYVPLIVKANSEDKFTILNLYQKWGQFNLKQISSIQYFSPYYHLSMGTTETNCLVPFGSSGLSLPDFRTMSSPVWSNTNPQHNSCGSHSFVKYTDSNGVFNANQMSGSEIYSYGPTYAEMSIEFISDDGKLKITYNHMEQPHTDENRSYFTINIEVLDDVSIKNFKEDFYFYGVSPNDPTGIYQRVGYLDTNNKSQVVAANKSGTPVEYVLGDVAPYFSFFDMDNYNANFNRDESGKEGTKGYANVAMLIADSKFIIGGEEREASFVLRDMTKTLRLTLDLDAVNLKAGDSLTIDGILMPWGSQIMEGTYDEIQDMNVRNVREDSIIKPLYATAVEDCEVVHKSVTKFLPELKSTNGKSATFTLAGGANDNAVRIYGFDMLTVPVVEELVDGEWKIYELCSASNLDQLGYGYEYDGYNVFYDGDGTYSYSFVVNMDDTEGRTFRITAAEEFGGWGEEKDPTEDLPFNYYIEPENMAALGGTLGQLKGCTVEFVEENGDKFFRFWGTGEKNDLEAYLAPYAESPLYPTTGQYLAFKYRMPTTNVTNSSYFQVYASTTTKSFTADGVELSAKGSVKKDGEWHTIIIDLSDIETYVPNEKGDYIAKLLRIDILNPNAVIPETDYIDIAYFGLSDNIDDILAISGDENYVSYYDESTLKKIDTKTGEISEDKDPINFYYDALEMGVLSTKGCNTVLSADKSYRQYFGKGSGEGEVFVYSGNGSKETGKYLVVKYRVPEGVNMATNFEIFASTTNASPAAGYSTSVSIIKDGNWQVLVIDLSRIPGYEAVDGKYNAKHVRLDIINGKFTHTEESPAYIDVAYLGLHHSLVDILELNKDMEEVTFFNKSGVKSTLPTDGSVEEPVEKPAVPDPINVYLSPDELYGVNINNMEPSMPLSEEYLTLTAKGKYEGRLNAYANSAGSKVTGQYLVLKYRVPEGSTNVPNNIEIFASTTNGAAVGADALLLGNFISDGEWHVMVINLAAIKSYTANDNGEYCAKYLRIDILNAEDVARDSNTFIDVAYVGLHGDLNEIYELNSDMETVQYYPGAGNGTAVEIASAAQ